MSEYFEMGGYAGYVWPAYGVSLAVLGGLVFAIWRRGRTLKSKLAKFGSKTDNRHSPELGKL